MLSKSNKDNYLTRYNNRLQKYGYDVKTLGWSGGVERQNLRFRELLKIINFSDREVKSVLDVGCGFADLYKYLKANNIKIDYQGVDINSELIKVTRKNYGDTLKVFCLDILKDASNLETYDIVIASGVFNFKLENQDQYEYIFQMLSKMYSMARIGISVDFMTTHVDWKEENTFYMEPGKLFEFGKNLSQKVILRSDYLPFEQCIYIMR